MILIVILIVYLIVILMDILIAVIAQGAKHIDSYWKNIKKLERTAKMSEPTASEQPGSPTRGKSTLAK